MISVLEVSTTSWRNAWTAVATLGYAVCQYGVTASAQYLRDWRMLLLVMGISYAIFIPYYW